MNHLSHAIRYAVALVTLGASVIRADEPALAARLDALEQRIEALALENRSLREQLAAQPKKAVAAVGIAGKEAKLSLGGYLHLQAETGDAADTRFKALDDRFLVRRARLTVKGRLNDDFAFKLESELGNGSIGGKSGYGAQLTDVFLDWSKYDAVQIRFGQFKTPFGYEQLMPDTKTPFVERSQVNDKLTVSRQIGAGLSGVIVPDVLDYSVGVFNGNGTNKGFNDNNDFLCAGRVAGHLVKRDDFTWDVAANAFSSEDAGTFTGRRSGWAIDSQVTWRALALQAEWLGNTYDPATGSDRDAEGWYLMGQYTINRHWQLAARYEVYDPNAAVSGDDENTLTLGLNWLIIGHDLKLSLDYLHGAAAFSGAGDRLLSRLQLIF